MNLLLDTNVFIDYLGRKDPFYKPAMQVVAAGFFGDATIWVPAQSAKDAFYVLNHYVSSERIQSAMLKSFEVIKPVSLSAEDTIRAARLKWPDYEDCLVSLCALQAKADYIVTRDSKGFTRSAVPTISPEELIELFSKEKKLSYDEVEI